MFSKKVHELNNGPTPVGAYSQIVEGNGLIFVSAIGSIDLDGNIIGHSIEEQTSQTLNNIVRMLHEVGIDKSSILKVNVYLSRIQDFDKFDAEYKKFFYGTCLPARATVGCELWAGLKIEMDAIAMRCK